MKSSNTLGMVVLLGGVVSTMIGCFTVPTAEDAKKYPDVGTYIRKAIALQLYPDGRCLERKSLDKSGSCDVLFAVSPLVFGPRREAESFVKPTKALKLYCEAHDGSFVGSTASPRTVGQPELDPVLVIASRQGAFGEMHCMKYGVPVWRATVTLGRYVKQDHNFSGALTVSYVMLGQ